MINLAGLFLRGTWVLETLFKTHRPNQPILGIQGIKSFLGEFPRDLVVKLLDLQCHDPGSILGQGIGIPRAMWRDQKKKIFLGKSLETTQIARSWGREGNGE